MATYTLDEVVGKKTYSLEEVLGQSPLSSSQRFAQGLKDPFDAGAQMLEKIAPEGVRNAVNQANNWLADKTGLVGKLPEGGVSQQISESEANYVAPEGMDWARMAGNVLSPANLAIASKIPVGATLGGRIASGVGGGAVLGAMQPVASGNFAEEKAKQAGIGAAFGGIVPAVTGSIARTISPNASLNPNVQLLKKEGVTPTIGQTLGGRLGQAEEKLQSVPILGDMISRSKNMANQSFEKAAYNKVLSPIGMKLPEGLSGRDAVSFTEQTLGSKYDDVLNKIGAIKIDGSYKLKESSLKSLAGKIRDKKAQDAFNSALDTVKDNIDENGIMTSEAFKMVESDLGKMASKLSISDDIFLNKAGTAVKQLQEELRSMLTRQAGDYSGELSKTNSAWARFKRIQQAASMLGAENGNFTPAQLQNAVKTLDKSKSKGKFAKGEALMQDLSDAGKSVLTGKVGNSFTTDRLLMGGGLGSLAGYLVDPMLPIGLTAGSMLYTQPAQKALVNAVSSRPELAQPVANAVRKSTPYLLPAIPGLLNYQ